MTYESVLLFGVLFIAEYLFATLSHQTDPSQHHDAMNAWLFFIVGIYFCWCWVNGGQTLPMKTWHIRVVTANGEPLRPWRAVLRYILAWMMFVPGLAAWTMVDTPSMMVLPMINFVLWLGYAVIDKERQFPHDRLAGTRLIAVPPAPARGKKAAKGEAA